MNENPNTEQCAQNNANDEDDATGTEHATETRKGEERPKQGSNRPRYLDDYVAK